MSSRSPTYSPSPKRKRGALDLMDIDSPSGSDTSPSTKRRKSTETKHNIIAKIKKIANTQLQPLKSLCTKWLQKYLGDKRLGGIF